MSIYVNENNKKNARHSKYMLYLKKAAHVNKFLILGSIKDYLPLPFFTLTKTHTSDCHIHVTITHLNISSNLVTRFSIMISSHYLTFSDKSTPVSTAVHMTEVLKHVPAQTIHKISKCFH